ncbi:MAG: hypothetical protein FJ311_05750 [Rhodospirillales bacterium]|nr:hypothetical protein [Rhodospirillales bacterium]
MRILGRRGHRAGLWATRAWLAIAVVALASACARPEPFVYKPAEFDRRNIGKPAPVPGIVQVCYHGPATSADAVLRLAEEECAKFGKSPQLIGQEITVCPMATPVAASYLCCPTTIDPNQRYRCSAAGGQVERLNNDQVREALAAQRRESRQQSR